MAASGIPGRSATDMAGAVTDTAGAVMAEAMDTAGAVMAEAMDTAGVAGTTLGTSAITATTITARVDRPSAGVH